MKGSIILDINHLMADRVGYQYGISPEAIEETVPQARAAFEAVEKVRGTGWLGWTELPYNQDEILSDIEETAKKVIGRFDAFVVLGIGGSALGPIAVHQALRHLHYNEGSSAKRKYPVFTWRTTSTLSG